MKQVLATIIGMWVLILASPVAILRTVWRASEELEKGFWKWFD